VPGEDDQWDLGTGAGFYVDATKEPWSKHYRMYSYVTKELPGVISRNFPVADTTRQGISGHSMGGHGALVAFLKNPDTYKAATAFAPISNPIESSWGVKCMTTYLGSDTTAWKEYDATELVKRQPRKDVKIIVEQGANDEWMKYLVPDNFRKACEESGQLVEFNMHDGYDHGYYFVSTFIEHHLKHFSGVL
jgi:S-formylglutathione hydrolase